MSEYRLLVADIDGTAVQHGSLGSELTPDHPTKIAVSQAHELGKIVTFATGRNLPKAEPILSAFAITDPVIVNEGSQIVNPVTGEIIYERRLDAELGDQICNLAEDLRVDPDLRVGFGYLEEIPFAERDSEQVSNLIYLDLIGLSREDDVQTILDFVATLDDAVAIAVQSPQFPGRQNIMVTDSKSTKYHALLKLQRILGVTISETIAVGDGDNDLPLFLASGLKIAVSNATERLKKAADLVVSSVDEHGMAEAITDHLVGETA